MMLLFIPCLLDVLGPQEDTEGDEPHNDCVFPRLEGPELESSASSRIISQSNCTAEKAAVQWLVMAGVPVAA